MRKLILILGLSLGLFWACSQKSDSVKGQTFGSGVNLSQSHSVAEVLENVDQFKGKTVRISGTVASVCQDEGCKLELVDGNRVITVRFKDDAFRAPRDCAGKTVNVEGVFLAQTGEIQCSEEAAGKTCPEANKSADAVFSGEDGCPAHAAANRINYNFIASGMVLL